MLLIIRKSKRANPPCGNLCCAYREYCFLPPIGVKHAAEMKAELRGKDIKGERGERAIQSMMCCMSLSSLPWYRWCWWQEVTRYERRIIRVSDITLCVTERADIFYWHVADIFCQWCQTRCVVVCLWEEQLQLRKTKRHIKVVRLVCQLSPFCFLSCLWFKALWLWAKRLAGFCLRSLDWRLSHDEAGLKGSQSFTEMFLNLKIQVQV